MARPKKQGLEYFPLDCRMDDKVEMLEAVCGLEGFAVYIKLLQEIYQTEDGKLDMSVVFRWKTLGKKYGIPEDNLKNIVNVMIQVGLFDKAIFDSEQMLTSSGVQKRIGKVSDLRDKDRRRKKDTENGLSDSFPAENPGKSTQKEKEKEKENKEERENAREEAKKADEDRKRKEYEQFCKRVDGFYLECVSHAYRSWAETSAKGLKEYGVKSLDQFYAKIESFRTHIQSTGEIHEDFNDFRSHVIRWIRAEFQKSQKPANPQRNAINPQSPPPGVSMYARAGIPD